MNEPEGLHNIMDVLTGSAGTFSAALDTMR